MPQCGGGLKDSLRLEIMVLEAPMKVVEIVCLSQLDNIYGIVIASV